MHQGKPATSFVQALLRYETEHVPARNLAARTRSEYRADLCQAIEFLAGELGLSDVAAVERGHLEAFLAELDRRGLSGSSRRRKLASLRSFFTYLNDVELIPHNPTSKLTPPARERPERRALSEAEYGGDDNTQFGTGADSQQSRHLSWQLHLAALPDCYLNWPLCRHIATYYIATWQQCK
jgi:hypothetical protein